jgi:hypothetical protein
MKKLIPAWLAAWRARAAGAQDMGKLLATGGVSQWKARAAAALRRGR